MIPANSTKELPLCLAFLLTLASPRCHGVYLYQNRSQRVDTGNSGNKSLERMSQVQNLLLTAQPAESMSFLAKSQRVSSGSNKTLTSSKTRTVRGESYTLVKEINTPSNDFTADTIRTSSDRLHGFLPPRKSSSVKPHGSLSPGESSSVKPHGSLSPGERRYVRPFGSSSHAESSSVKPHGSLSPGEIRYVRPFGSSSHAESSSVKPHGSLSPEESSVTGSGTTHSDSLWTTHPDSSFQRFRVYADDCSLIDDPFSLDAEFSAMRGEVQGLYTRSETFNLTKVICQWNISVPEGYFLYAEFDALDDLYTSYFNVKWGYFFPSISHGMLSSFLFVNSGARMSPSNIIYLRLSASRAPSTDFSRFRMRFKAVREDPHTKLTTVMTSSNSGYLTSPGYNGQRAYPMVMNVEHVLNLPENHTIMLIFERFDLHHAVNGPDNVGALTSRWLCADRVTIFTLDRNSRNAKQVWMGCGTSDVAMQIYDKPLIIRFVTDSTAESTGFKIKFSIQPWSTSPRRLQSGLFDCSVPYYASIKQHVQCNMKQECEGGEDEGDHCPVCNAAVAVNNKCYKLIEKRGPIMRLQRECKQRNSQPATIKTRQELEAFSNLFLGKSRYLRHQLAVGLFGYESSMPQYYRHTLKWHDNTINYNMPTRRNSLIRQTCELGLPKLCFYYQFHSRPQLQTCQCAIWSAGSFICEFPVNPKFGAAENKKYPRPVLSPVKRSAFQRFGDSVLTCPSGHVTFTALACHVEGRCGVAKPLPFCPFPSPPSQQKRDNNIAKSKPVHAVPTFGCRQGTDVVPYSLVCDFWINCPDGSDEDICNHDLPCPGHRCSNGQCIATSQVCDSYNHCVDKSDETECNFRMGHWDLPNMFPMDPPAIINFDGSGYFNQTSMDPSDACPDTHFRCQGELDYCLPVYVLCNGVYDCLGHEDEAGCDQAELCPGFYRCWDSTVCLHPDHMCDGVPQCQRHDDELFCHATCPRECQCQGLSVVCSQPFSSQDFSDLRYLDASGSGATPQAVLNHSYLVWTSFASCKLTHLPVMFFPNLFFLDLSENLLTVVSMDVFVEMKSLDVLTLAGNPVVTLLSGKPAARASSLQQLDISRTRLSAFDSRALNDFFNVRILNISHSSVARIVEGGFRYVSNLRRLDLRGNDIREHPADAFKTLTELQFLYSSDFRFCCRMILPEHYDEIACQSPQDEVSSCEDLLRSNVYRACLWLIGVMSIVGNAGSFLFRCVALRKVTKTGFSVFVTNLCLADLLMGVYLVMVGAADSLYRGQYLFYERSWTASAVCKTAGFLSLLSSEVSAFIICLITLDRFIVLRFPFSTTKFRKKSALVASALVWIAGILLAVVPLLPVTSHWEFYGQSGICIPLPITRKTFAGRDYSFGVIIVFNFILFAFIAGGQSVIYLSVRSNLLTTDTTKISQEATIARRLLTVVVSDFACWFPIGVLGLLASAGVPIPGEVNVAVAIFVLPLNSALNPFLYTFNTLMERRRKLLELKLMKVLEAKAITRETNPECLHGNANSSAGLTVDQALRFLGRSLATKRTTLEEINSALVKHTSRDDNGT